MPGVHRKVAVLLVAASAALLGSVSAAGAANAATPADTPLNSVYVAMGDSYTAGPLILPMTDTFVCARSALNYPSLLARALHVTTFRDVSCSSAATRDFSNPQPGNVSGTNPPEYTALSADTTLVTVGIGGNDIGLVQLAENCLNLLPAPFGKSCAAKYTAGGVDVYGQKIAAFADTYGTVIDTIHERSPHAKVLMIGYPTTIQHNGCFPVEPVLGPDANYIQAKIDQLNSVMATESAAHGATYIDLRTSTIGHDSCQMPGTRWLEGLVPLSPAFPLHPNVLAMRNAASVIYAALQPS
jgi:lysophospholipase L1-like esterase